MYIYIYTHTYPGWWLSPAPLKNMKVSWEYEIPQYMEQDNSGSKPPISVNLINLLGVSLAQNP